MDGETDSEEVRREDLRALLTAYRARIQPTDVGLPTRPNQRGPGLRQDQVAALAGVSPRWYASLERGEHSPDDAEPMTAVARVLRMSEEDHAAFFVLATGHPPASPVHPAQKLTDLHRDVLRYAEPHIAAILDHAGYVLGANQSCSDLFGITGATGRSAPNATLWLFSDAAASRFPEVTEVRIAAITRVRQAMIRFPNDVELETVLAQLLAIPEASKHWHASHQVANRPLLQVDLRHPSRGVVAARGIATELPDGLQVVVLYLAPQGTGSGESVEPPVQRNAAAGDLS